MLAYLDTSCLVAVAFAEPGAEELAETLAGFDRLISSNLLEAEFRSVLAREAVSDGEALLSWITWLHPDRPLAAELRRALAFDYLRGADLWHLGCALFLRPELPDLRFLTLDQRQGEVARALGFEGLEARLG
jgi:predicted nucleic acid-binding protein